MTTKKAIKTVPIHTAAQQAVNTPPGRNPELMRRLYQTMQACRALTAEGLGARHSVFGREAILAAAMAGALPEDAAVVAAATDAVRIALEGSGAPSSQKNRAGEGRSASIIECGFPGSEKPLATSTLVGLGTGIALSRPSGVVIAICGTTVRLREEADYLRLSAARKLPLVIVSEHNIARKHAGGHSPAAIEKTARSFGVPGMIVDGSDVLAVYRVVQEALYRARHGGGPTLIECKTWRPSGTSRTTLPPARLRHWVQGDPLEYMERQLKARGFWPEEWE